MNPFTLLLLWLIRGYQRLVSPALPSCCKYYPSCSQYAMDAIGQYGAARGLVLAGWRLLRCNPLSYGGYDPVERQTIFGEGRRRREAALAAARNPRTQILSCGSQVTPARRRKPRSLVVICAVVVTLAFVTLFTSSCSVGELLGVTTTTTVGASSTTAVGGETTTTTLKEAGTFARTLKPLEALFFYVLEFLHDHLKISWSWAIVLLTVIVRVILIPLTWRQLKSMRAMQALAPQIKALQEKYKDDRQLLNQKTMEFYRENKVSPFGSCLPLLLQLPVFFGLYYMLQTAGAANLDPASAGRWAGIFADPTVSWLWISDITKFDAILMFLYIVSQFVASWQMARNSPGQQKMIAYFMPIMVGIFMYIGKWPAGLFIYWFTSNLWTIAQQYVAEKMMPLPAAVVASSAKTTSGKPATTKSAGTKAAPKAAAPKPAAGKTGPTKSTPAKSGPPKTTPAKASSGKKPAVKSGGKSSVQETGKQRKTTTGQGERADSGDGGPEGSGRT